MRKVMSDIKEMMELFEQEVQEKAEFPDAETRKLRRGLLREEYEEYVDAEEANDLVEVADALADMVVIIAGTAHAYGIPLDRVWDAVHRSNMAKRDPETGQLRKREDGKVIKPDSWTEPDIKSILD